MCRYERVLLAFIATTVDLMMITVLLLSQYLKEHLLTVISISDFRAIL